MVYIWVPAAAWGVVNLARVLIDWHARIRYEKVRAASIAVVLQSAPAGATVHDRRRDGTLLRIEIPIRHDHEGSDRDRATVAGRPTC
jgi:hypothetical protein